MIWKKVQNYVNNVESYYISNQLINNVSKTNVMIITKDKNAKKTVNKYGQ